MEIISSDSEENFKKKQKTKFHKVMENIEKELKKKFD